MAVSSKDPLLDKQPPKCYLPARYVLAFFFFLAGILHFSQKICFSVTIVAMVNHTAFNKVDLASNESLTDTCSSIATSNDIRKAENEGKYLWSPSMQGVILGTYFYGYTITHIIGGRLPEIVGGKWPLGISIFGSSLLTLATPVVADLGYIPIAILRFLIGFLHGLIITTAYAMFAQWAPVREKSTLLSIPMMGNQMGTIIVMPLSAYLIEYGFAGGWPSVYYVLGTAGCVLSIFWSFLAYNKPTDHPRISAWELNYIQKDQQLIDKNQKLKVPWIKIMSSGQIWCLIVAVFCGNWGFTTMLTELPTYLQLVLKFPIRQNGLANAMMYISSFLTMFGSSLLSDYLRIKRKISPTLVRKGFDLFTSFGPAVCISLVPYVECNYKAAVALFTLITAFYSCSGGGRGTIPPDLSPHHAATLHGIIYGIGGISSVIAPIFAGFVQEKKSVGVEQWSSIFYVASGMYALGGIIFLLFASSERQPWGKTVTDDDPKLPSDEQKKAESQKYHSEGYGTMS